MPLLQHLTWDPGLVRQSVHQLLFLRFDNDHLLLLAKSTIPLIFLCQLGLIPISYKWNRSAFFTTDELLPAEEFRRQQVDDWEDRMANEQLKFIAEQRMKANSIPILNLPVEVSVS